MYKYFGSQLFSPTRVIYQGMIWIFRLSAMRRYDSVTSHSWIFLNDREHPLMNTWLGMSVWARQTPSGRRGQDLRVRNIGIRSMVVVVEYCRVGLMYNKSRTGVPHRPGRDLAPEALLRVFCGYCLCIYDILTVPDQSE